MESKYKELLSAKNIEYFNTLVKTKSYTQASRILGISQPALTQRIKHLENEIGVRLFKFEGRNLVLTLEGQEYYRYSLRILSVASEASNNLQKYSSKEDGTVKIALDQEISEEIFHNFLAIFIKKHPRLHIVIERSRQNELINRIKNNEIDFGISYSYKPAISHENNLVFHKLLEDEILYIKNSSRKDNLFINKSRLQGADYICFADKSFDEYLNDSNVDELRPVIELTDMSEILKLSKKLGVNCFVSKSYIDAIKWEGNVSHIIPKFDIDIELIFKSNAELIPHNKIFKDEIENIFNISSNAS